MTQRNLQAGPGWEKQDAGQLEARLLTSPCCAQSVLAQNSSSAKKDAAKGSIANNASQSSPDDFLELLRKDARSEKKQIIAENMELSDAEAEKFWPVYDRYAADLSKIYDTQIALLNDYAENYGSMTGEQAENYIRRRAEVEQSIMQLRLKYIPAFRKVLSRQGNSIVLSTRLAARSGDRRRTGAKCR